MASKGPECSICFECYNDQNKCPRMLSCGHSFCSSCLERLLHVNSIDCPTCRHTVAVPSGVHDLLKNFALLDIVNEAPKEQAGNTENTGSHNCEVCDEKHPATFFCLDCKENMCKTAAQFHTRNKTSRDHKVVSLKELEANPHAFVSLICQKHNDKFRFFDEKCGQVVCRECVALEHFGHECLPLDIAAFKYREIVKGLIEETNSRFEKTKFAEDGVATVWSELKKAHEKGAADILSFFEELRSALSTREQQLSTELDGIYKKKADILKEQQEVLGLWKTFLESVKKRAESTIQISGSAKLLISILDVKSDLENVIKCEEPEFEPRTDSKLCSVVCDRGFFLDILKKAGDITDLSGDNTDDIEQDDIDDMEQANKQEFLRKRIAFTSRRSSLTRRRSFCSPRSLAKP